MELTQLFGFFQLIWLCWVSILKKSHFVLSANVDKTRWQNLDLLIGSSLANFLYEPFNTQIPVIIWNWYQINNLSLFFAHVQFLLWILYTLTSVCIFSILFSIHFLRCWQREFNHHPRASLAGDLFLYSHDLNDWFRGDIVRRNWLLITPRSKMIEFVSFHFFFTGLATHEIHFTIIREEFKPNQKRPCEMCGQIGKCFSKVLLFLP